MAEITLVELGDQLCVAARTAGAGFMGTACGATRRAAAAPPVAVFSGDASRSLVAGAAPDGVEIVELVDATGRSTRVRPRDNVFATLLATRVGRIVLHWSDGARSEL